MTFQGAIDIIRDSVADSELREVLAGLAHTQWAGWMEYLLDKSIKNGDGSVTIPKDYVERWTRQMNVDYEQLSRPEKESDRKEADKFMVVMRNWG